MDTQVFGVRIPLRNLLESHAQGEVSAGGVFPIGDSVLSNDPATLTVTGFVLRSSTTRNPPWQTSTFPASTSASSPTLLARSKSEMASREKQRRNDLQE